MIGGFTPATSGEIALEGKQIKSPGVDRGYVFQNYALFPWMNVEKNILYSLKLQKISLQEQERRLKELLSIARLEGHEKKYPIQLSGGMRQRVAVVRALASRPRVLLLDEPLGAVDFQMREIMQNEFNSLIANADTTAVMVTHDVSESVFLSDRVIVMGANGGKVIANVRIDLKKPRERNSSQFKEYVSKLTDLVRQAFYC
jgi:NitT/TauT family transport system ATP-binding protein